MPIKLKIINVENNEEISQMTLNLTDTVEEILIKILSYWGLEQNDRDPYVLYTIDRSILDMNATIASLNLKPNSILRLSRKSRYDGRPGPSVSPMNQSGIPFQESTIRNFIELIFPSGRKLQIKDGYILGRSDIEGELEKEKLSMISRNHCEIQINERKAHIRDGAHGRASLNGTYVDGANVPSTTFTLMKNRSKICLGNVVTIEVIFH